MGLSLFLLAEQSTMTTESGSDSESKPEQEAEPQEAAGPQGPEGVQQGPEEQHQALEQFTAAAAHSTPVRKEVSPWDPHCPTPLQQLASPRKPIKECLLSSFRVWSDLGLLALEGTMGGVICFAPSGPRQMKIYAILRLSMNDIPQPCLVTPSFD